MAEGLVAGRIVYFVVDAATAEAIAQQRFGVVYGNDVDAGDIVPALIVKVWSGVCVNLKLLLDGPDTYWATSVEYSADPATPRSWHWMFERQAGRYAPAEPPAETPQKDH